MTKEKTFYITTPIYYVNDVPHMGHAYTTVAADTLARYKRLTGLTVRFLTGTDEHGQKIQKAAQQRGLTPKGLADQVVVRFKELWEKLNISNDDFIRTTEERHYQSVQALFEKVFQQGDIYKGEYEDWYCIQCEMFWTELVLVNGKCPDCSRPVEKLKEESYFFRMSKYQERLLLHLEENPDFIQPKSRQNEIIRFVQGGLKDLSISRTSFDWGIPLPKDPKHVIYVWFDALTNYLTAAGFPDDIKKMRQLWPVDVHIIGKDILRFHAVYWPTFLMSVGLPLPKKIFSHGWWTVEGEKMSKSKGNVIDPHQIVNEIGVDAFRYFLLREVPFGGDGDFSKEALTHRFNGDLANDLGNLLSRTLKMIEQYSKGKIPSPKGGGGPLQEMVSNLYSQMEKHMNHLEFHKALGKIFQLVDRSNRYIEETAPWKMAKSTSEQTQLKTVLYNTAEVLRVISLYLYPFMPSTAILMAQQLGTHVRWEDSLLKPQKGQIQWGKLQPGTRVQKGAHLFPRLNDTDSSRKNRPYPQKEKPLTEGESISIQDFSKIHLRVGQILSAEAIPKSNKLLKLKVDIGSEQRQIVAGIGQKYSPEALIGKKVAVVVNLKPAKLMGVESQGMVLAAGDQEVQSLLTLLEDAPPGTQIK